MKKDSLLAKILTNKQMRDYTSATLFLIISAVFTFLAVKPSLSTAFSLKKEAEDLKKMNEAYEENIEKITVLQSQLADIGSKTYLLYEAMPEKPQINPIINSYKQSAVNEGIILKSFSLSSSKINLKGGEKDTGIEILPIDLDFDADYNKLNNFINNIVNRRRITVFKSIDISESKEATATISGDLNFKGAMEAYYIKK